MLHMVMYLGNPKPSMVATRYICTGKKTLPTVRAAFPRLDDRGAIGKEREPAIDTARDRM